MDQSSKIRSTVVAVQMELICKLSIDIRFPVLLSSPFKGHTSVFIVTSTAATMLLIL